MLTRPPAARISPTPTEVTPSPADLNQSGDHGLPEKREMIRRVDRDQAGNADRAGRSEQGVDKADLRARADRDRQQEQPCAEQDHECKTQGDQPRAAAA